MEWTRVEPISPGIHQATVTNIRLALGATSGKPMLVWTFQLDSGPSILLYTSMQGVGSLRGYEAAQALGLTDKWKLSDAEGRRCQLRIESDKLGMSITRVIPVAGTDRSTQRPPT